MEILELPLASIEVGSDRARDLEPAWAEALSVLIGEQGLQQPILVRAVEGHPEKYRLIAGLHRMKAHELLGAPTIPAYLSSAESDDAARLEEVMENLGRYELIALDRCHHLYELKQLWLRKHPEFANGGGNQRGGNGGQSSPTDGPEVFGFATSVAEQIGLAKRTINAAVKIWTGLYPPVRQRLRGTDLARKQTELKALSELPKHVQVKVLDAIENPELLDVGNVAQALDYLGGTIACDPVEKRFAAVSKTIAALDDETFDSVIVAHQDRVIASLKRLGRI